MKTLSFKKAEEQIEAVNIYEGVTDHVEAAKSILSCIAGMDAEFTSAFESGHVQHLALQGLNHLVKVTELIDSNLFSKDRCSQNQRRAS